MQDQQRLKEAIDKMNQCFLELGIDLGKSISKAISGMGDAMINIKLKGHKLPPLCKN